MAIDYIKELESIQTWIKSVAGLNSYRLKNAKPKLARPVILWEMPSRGKARNLSRYTYVIKVRQYGRLFVKDLEESISLQEKLMADLEENNNVIPVMDQGRRVAYLKEVAIEFDTTDGLDVPFNITYEATYGKTRPAEPPAATYVGTRITTKY